MRPEFSPEPVAPQVIHHPLLAQHYAQQAARIAHSPSSAQAQSDRGRRGHPQGATGASPPTLEEAEEIRLHAERSRARLGAVRAAVGQLADLTCSVAGSLEQTPIGTNSHRANERILRSAAGAAKDIVSHAEHAGEPLFNVNQYYLSGRTLAASSRSALAAYGSTRRPTTNSPDPPLVQRALEVVEIHLTGFHGVLNRLQDLAENGPHSVEGASEVVKSIRETLTSLESVVDDARDRGLRPPLEHQGQPGTQRNVDQFA